MLVRVTRVDYECGCFYYLRSYKKDGYWRIEHDGQQFCDRHFEQIMEGKVRLRNAKT